MSQEVSVSDISLSYVLRRFDDINKCDCKLISPDCICKYKFNDTGMQ